MSQHSSYFYQQPSRYTQPTLPQQSMQYSSFGQPAQRPVPGNINTQQYRSHGFSQHVPPVSPTQSRFVPPPQHPSRTHAQIGFQPVQRPPAAPAYANRSFPAQTSPQRPLNQTNMYQSTPPAVPQYQVPQQHVYAPMVPTAPQVIPPSVSPAPYGVHGSRHAERRPLPAPSPGSSPNIRQRPLSMPPMRTNSLPVPGPSRLSVNIGNTPGFSPPSPVSPTTGTSMSSIALKPLPSPGIGPSPSVQAQISAYEAAVAKRPPEPQARAVSPVRRPLAAPATPSQANYLPSQPSTQDASIRSPSMMAGPSSLSSMPPPPIVNHRHSASMPSRHPIEPIHEVDERSSIYSSDVSSLHVSDAGFDRFSDITESEPTSPLWGIRDLPSKTQQVIDQARVKLQSLPDASEGNRPPKPPSIFPTHSTSSTLNGARRPVPPPPKHVTHNSPVKQPQPMSPVKPSWTLPPSSSGSISTSHTPEPVPEAAPQTSMAFRMAALSFDDKPPAKQPMYNRPQSSPSPPKPAQQITTPTRHVARRPSPERVAAFVPPKANPSPERISAFGPRVAKATPERPSAFSNNRINTSPEKTSPFTPRRALPSPTRPQINLSLDEPPPLPLRRTPSPVSPAPSSTSSITMVNPPEDYPRGRTQAPPNVPVISLPGGAQLEEEEDGDWTTIKHANRQGAPPIPTFNLPDEPLAINIESVEDNHRGPKKSLSPTSFSTLPTILVASGTSSVQNDPSQAPGNSGTVVRPRGGGGLYCGGCGRSIVGRIVSAMGARWHPQCFKCCICGELLEHVSSYENEGRPYCHLDYHERFAPRCFHCQTPIIDERFITLDDPALGKRAYHELHFFCAECGDPFLAPSGKPARSGGEINITGDGEFDLDDDDVGFTVYKGHPYCETCHVRLRMPKCKKCKKSIRDGMRAVEALGGKWCWECFTCARCDQPFENPSFFQRDQKAFCEPCFSLMIRNEI